MQLFLLHFAGGNCYSYEFLKRMIPKDVNVFSLELPGRGRRYKEHLLFNKKTAIADYVQQIRALRDQGSYVIYGHSMGATLGISVVKAMEEYDDAPLALIASGNPGPGIHEDEEAGETKKIYLLDDIDFKAELKKLGGLPDEILENEELFDFFGPTIRADFEILEKEAFFEKDLRINAPIYAIMGDKEAKVKYITNWKNYTNNWFNNLVLTGNHFFIHNHAETLVNIIMECSKGELINQQLNTNY